MQLRLENENFTSFISVKCRELFFGGVLFVNAVPDGECHDPLPVGIFLAAEEFRSSQEAKATEEQCKDEYK